MALVLQVDIRHNTEMHKDTQPKDILFMAKAVGVVRHHNTLLEDINLTMKRHDFITVVGPNGAGKSTLLKALMGIEPISSGVIERASDLKIGYVPQSFIVNPSLPITVRRFLSLDKRIDPIRIDETLEALALSQHQSTSLHQLSGGERQRVLVARALLRQPDLLVLDEPAQNLDVRAQLKLYELLSEFYKQSKISILMVSHDLHLVMSLTTQVICLYQHICCAGSPKMVTKDPAFTHLFGDEFAQMMAVYHHQHDHGHHHE